MTERSNCCRSLVFGDARHRGARHRELRSIAKNHGKPFCQSQCRALQTYLQAIAAIARHATPLHDPYRMQQHNIQGKTHTHPWLNFRDVFFFPGPGGSTRRKRRILGRLSSKPFDRHMARRFFFALSPLSRKSKLAWKSARGGWCLILRDTWYTVLQQEAFPCAPRRIYYCHTLVDATTRTTRVDCLTDRPLHLFIRTRFDPLTDRPLH